MSEPRVGRIKPILRVDDVETPSIGDTLEPMSPTIFELDFRLEDKVFYGAGNEHFAGARFGGYASANMNRDANDFATDHLVFARMQTRSDLKAEGSHRVTN